ncbi:hypothetical protein ACIRSS_15815 [Amycolatopsis sp. NPDC101161]|uniref:hypothetical protein n=1 Tax=Amycolatopsis sp. NPDC101161 TaxID=3363940 RepID=UPI0037FE4A23
MFYTLYPGQGDIATWAKEAYSNWWASPEKGVLGYGLYFIVATWGVYIITQQNIVGYCIIEGLWRSRSAIRFGADPVNTDGYFGWAVVRESLVATYTELAMHGVALACVAITMPPGSLVGPMAVASFQWMVSLPVHLGFPFLFVGRTIRRFKADELERLDNTVQAIDPTLPEHEKIAIQDTISRRMEVIRSVPTLPFKSFRDTSIFVISLIADSAAVIALLLVLFHI